MSLQRIFRVGSVCTTGAVLLLALVPVGMCQTASVQKEEPAPSDTIDEITVYGNKSLRKLRLDLYTAEDNVYAVFNSLNSDDEYDVHCYHEARYGSRITRRVCRANFVSEAIADETRALLRDQPEIPAWATIQQKNKLLREKVEALVIERPELLKALSEFSDAKQILESERQRRCEGRVIICRR